MITVYFGRHYVKADDKNVAMSSIFIVVSGEVEIDGTKKVVKNLMIPLTSVAYIIEEEE